MKLLNLRGIGGRVGVEYRRAGARRVLDRGSQLFSDRSAAPDIDACRQGRGHGGVLLRVPGLQFIRTHHAQVEDRSAAECGFRFSAGIVQSEQRTGPCFNWPT